MSCLPATQSPAQGMNIVCVCVLEDLREKAMSLPDTLFPDEELLSPDRCWKVTWNLKHDPECTWAASVTQPLTGTDSSLILSLFISFSVRLSYFTGLYSVLGDVNVTFLPFVLVLWRGQAVERHRGRPRLKRRNAAQSKTCLSLLKHSIPQKSQKLSWGTSNTMKKWMCFAEMTVSVRVDRVYALNLIIINYFLHELFVYHFG